MIVFISYATPDSGKFMIPYFADGLKNYPDIKDVLILIQF